MVLRIGGYVGLGFSEESGVMVGAQDVVGILKYIMRVKYDLEVQCQTNIRN